MNLNQLDTRIATREAGTTARGATRPWGFGNIAPGPSLPHGSAHPGPNTDRVWSNGYDPTRPIRGFAQIHVSGTGGPGKYGNFLLSPQRSSSYFGGCSHFACDATPANSPASVCTCATYARQS